MAVNIEQWRLIDGYDNYEVSSHGRVRNNKTDRILKYTVGTKGYQAVGLSKDCNPKRYDIHRLVCFAFCPNPNNYNIVDHIDRDKINNMANNLRWCTSSENNKNTGLRKDNTSGCKGVVNRMNGWQAQWVENDGKQHFKSFSIRIYGNEEAKTLAIDYRKQKEQEYGYI